MPDEKPEQQHNVFISWSGNRSRHVAEALRDWLPMVIQAAKPFLSKKDIDKGSRWHIDLAKALESTKVGIVCLTPENLTAPWLLFESGALSKTVDTGTRVCTYLLAGLKAEEVARPLGEFQATKAEREDTLQMLQDINRALGSPVSEQTLGDVFDLAWPKLEAKLTRLPDHESPIPPKRETEDMVAEILELVRAEANLNRTQKEAYAAMVQQLTIDLAKRSAAEADIARRVVSPIGNLSDLATGYSTPQTRVHQSIRDAAARRKEDDADKKK